MLIAHDLGTTGNKASLHDDSGRLLAAVTVGYPTHYSSLRSSGPSLASGSPEQARSAAQPASSVYTGTVSEQDPEDWWRAVVEATRALLAEGDVRPSEVAGICVSGQMMGAVLLDAAGRPVRPAMIWSDSRSAAEAAALEQAVGAEAGYRITGNRFGATYNLPKLMWVRANEPEAWARTRATCVAKDYVNYRLTGRLATDHSDASHTGAYDLSTGGWSPELLDAAGMDAGLLPEILDSTTILGTLTAQAASDLGLPAGTRVVTGGGDGPMAAVGAGCVAPGGSGYVCLGTSAWYATTTSAPVLDPRRRSFMLRHVVPGAFTPTATTQSGAGSLQWLREAVAPEVPVATLIAEAAEVRAADDGLFFLPYLIGERSPWWDAKASGVFLGLRRQHTRAHLVRAVLEGVGYTLALCIEAIGTPSAPIDVIGGGAASDTWLQLLSDIWGTPVRRRSVTDQANSLGAAVTGLVGLGLADFGIAPELSRVEAEFEPSPESTRQAAYRARFEAAYHALAGWFE